jgi:hypothetical protein
MKFQYFRTELIKFIIYLIRALIEEEYAKRLMRIAKIPIGKDESGYYTKSFFSLIDLF